jgi:hypothetical protein
MAQSQNVVVSSLKTGEDAISFDDFLNERHATRTDPIGMVVLNQIAERVPKAHFVFAYIAA